jgi:hypothetical protein
MANAKGKAKAGSKVKAKPQEETEFGLDTELTRFLVMLSVDEQMRSLYVLDPKALLDNWPFPLDKDVVQALKQRDLDSIRDALISQFGSTNSVVKRHKRPGPKKARPMRSR